MLVTRTSSDKRPGVPDDGDNAGVGGAYGDQKLERAGLGTGEGAASFGGDLEAARPPVTKEAGWRGVFLL